MKKSLLLTALLAGVTFSFCFAALASDLTVTTEVYGGTLSDSVSALNFGSATLTGKDGVTVNFVPTSYWQVTDARGTGAGWQVTVSATSPSSGLHQISLDNLSVDVTDVVTGPDAASSSDPSAIKRAGESSLASSVTLVSALKDQGMGSFCYNPVFTLRIPASAYAGTYTCTLTTTIYDSDPVLSN